MNEVFVLEKEDDGSINLGHYLFFSQSISIFWHLKVFFVD